MGPSTSTIFLRPAPLQAAKLTNRMAMFDFGAFPVLSTTRLDLQAIDAHFVDDLFAVRSDPVVQLYNSTPHETRDQTLRFIAEQQVKYSSHQEISWAVQVRATNQVVGDVTLFDWDPYHRRALLGYELAQDQWDKGWWASACSVSTKRVRFIQFSNCEHRFDEILDTRETLLGGKSKHLSDLSAIDTVLVGQ